MSRKVFLAVFTVFLFSSFALAASTTQKSMSLGIKAFAKKEYTKSRRYFLRVLEANPGHARAWFNLGTVQLVQKKFRKAAVSFEKSIELKSPLSPIAHIYLAQSYRKLKKLKKSARSLSEIKDIVLPPNSDLFRKNEVFKVKTALFKRAQGFYKKRQYREANSVVNWILNLDPVAEAYYFRGLIWKRLDNRRKSDQSFEKARRLGFAPEIGAEDRPSRLQITLDAAYGSNSNALALADSDRPLSSNAYRTSGNMGLGLLESLYFQLSGYFENTYEIISSEYGSIGAALRYADSSLGWFWKLRPFYKSKFYSATLLAANTGALVQGGKTFSDVELGVEAEKYSTKGVELHEYLNGSTLSARGWISLMLSSVDLTLSGLYKSVESQEIEYTTGTLPTAYKSLGAQLRMDIFPNDDLLLAFSAKFAKKDYNSKSLPEKIKRQDNQVEWSGQVRYFASTMWSYYLQYEGLKNVSNMNEKTFFDKNYMQHVVFCGITWSKW